MRQEPVRPTPYLRYALGWFAVAALLLLSVAVLGATLPADLANHRGESRPATVRAISIEPLRGGEVATYEVLTPDGTSLGTLDDVYGADATHIGQTYSARVIMSEGEAAAAYVEGEDPFVVNAAVAAAALTACLVTTAYAVLLLRRSRPSRIGRRYRKRGTYLADR